MAEAEALSWLDMGSWSFEGYTEALRPHLDQATTTFVNRWRMSESYNDSPDLQADIDVYARLLSGGKRVRAGLTVLGYENSDGDHEYLPGALTAAVAYDLLHNAFLVHDDIEDNSPLRRGRPTAHEHYRTQIQPVLGDRSSQYGIAVAINTGNIGATRALEAVWQINNHPSRIATAQRWLTQVMDITLQGQRRDLSYKPLPELTREEVIRIHEQKTAFYTITGPLNLGAILAGTNKRQLEAQSSFGRNLGVAFQIVDDHLGLYGDEQIVGKPVGSDIKESKKTLQFVEAYQRGNPSQQRLLLSLWGKDDLTLDQVRQVQALVDELGVKEQVLAEARDLAEQARRSLDKVTDKPSIRKILEDLIDFTVYRQY